MQMMRVEPVLRTGFDMARLRQPVRRTGSTLQGADLLWSLTVQRHDPGRAPRRGAFFFSPHQRPPCGRGRPV